MATKANKQHTARASQRAKAIEEAEKAVATFHVRLRVLRLHFGLSEDEMSRRLGVQPATYRRWERGQLKRIGGSLLLRISEETNVSIDWLATGGFPRGGLSRRNDNRPLALGGRPLSSNIDAAVKERAA